MSTFAQKQAEDRRLVVLQHLVAMPGYVLNEKVLRTALACVGHTVSPDIVRADVQWLEEQRLVRVERLPIAPHGEMWLVHLTGAGQAVAEGQRHEGVARPGAV